MEITGKSHGNHWKTMEITGKSHGNHSKSQCFSVFHSLILEENENPKIPTIVLTRSIEPLKPAFSMTGLSLGWSHAVLAQIEDSSCLDLNELNGFTMFFHGFIGMIMGRIVGY